MKRIVITIGLFIAIFLLSLFPSWNFSRDVTFSAAENPLWDSSHREISSLLTESLNSRGFKFYTNRGAEADPDGICFGDFGSDEYWVIQYDANNHTVKAYAWIIKVNWLGNLIYSMRFSALEKLLDKHLTDKAEQAGTTTLSFDKNDDQRRN